jgi:hypothetical protein
LFSHTETTNAIAVKIGASTSCGLSQKKIKMLQPTFENVTIFQLESEFDDDDSVTV